ncbi:hypothetical protein [Oceanobacillus halophilus]|uniref:Uncharacterized protein n=1 Tax=Oceanobacillus halophilus TaxID=930130 RepID=A0A495A582_9BACI|nr:hypothetical protein [Oceanobacillus halophilus]RKQ34263.1 hypothetical protein D8M06_07730 [Oceanobacillus halophilus]
MPTLSQVVAAGTISVITAGAITLGGMTYWNGNKTVNDAITTLQEHGNKIELYEMNENQLVAKINELKSLRDDLQTQINTLTDEGKADDEEIAGLKAEVEDYTNQITSLTDDLNTANEEIATAEDNGDKLAQRILDLEAELQNANDDITRLQEQLATTTNQTSDKEPKTDSEMAIILEEPTTEDGTTQDPVGQE